MFELIKKYQEASNATKGFIWTIASVILIIIITTVLAYGRLDYVRPYKEKPNQKTEQVSSS